MGIGNLLPLPSQSFTTGGDTKVVDLTSLPAEAELVGFHFVIEATGTVGSGTQAVTAEDLAQVLAKVDIDSNFLQVRATGRSLHILGKHATGYKTASKSQSVSVGTGGNSLRAVVPMWLRDKRGRRPSDFAIPCQLIRDKSIQLQAKTALTLVFSGPVTVTLTNVVVRPYAIVQPMTYMRIPSKTSIYFEDFTAATHRLQRPGLLQYLSIYDESDLAVTLAEYAQLSLDVGERIIDRTNTAMLVANWNELLAEAAADELSYVPSASNDFLPIFTAPQHFSLTKLPQSGDGGMKVDIESGSLTAGRFLVRQVSPCTVDDMRIAASLYGRPADASWEIETASKEPMDDDETEFGAAFLPKRLAS